MKLSTLFAAALAAAMAGQSVAQGSDENQDVFAKRGEGVVTHDMFDTRVSRIPGEHRLNVIRDKGRVEDLIDSMLLNAQLAAAARDAGLDKDPQIQSRMRLAAEEELASAWRNQYASTKPEADYDAMAREYYQVNPDRFKSQKSIDVSHILIGTETRPDDEARGIADDLKRQLEQSPGQFDDLVRQYSDDPSAKSNLGRFKSVKRGQMVKGFENTAFNLEPGQISMPVKTQYGFHIIRLDAVNQPRERSFQEVRETLVARMRMQHHERILSDYLSELSVMETELRQEDLEEMVERQFGGELGW